MKNLLFAKKMSAGLCLTALIFSLFGNTVSAVSYPLDGSFTTELIQTNQQGQNPRNASITIRMGGNANGFSLLNNTSTQCFNQSGPTPAYPYGIFLDFSSLNISQCEALNGTDIIRNSGAFIIDPFTAFTTKATPTQIAAAMVAKGTLGTAFTITSGGGRDVIFTRTDYSEGNIVYTNSIFDSSDAFQVVATVNGLSYIPSRVQQSSFTPANVGSGELYIMDIEGYDYQYTAQSGATVSDVTAGIVAEYNLAPVPFVSCVDQATRIFCSAALDTQTFSTDSYVVYPTADVTAPLITLEGDADFSLEFGTPFVDPGASWIDNRDGTGTVNYNSGTLHQNTLGNYLVGYSHMDASNNLSNEVVRIIRVVDTTAPTLQLIGSNPITHELDEYFPDIDPGANWTDSYDGSGTVYSDATFSGTGSTKIKYTYVDSSGNTGSISRTVNVIDTIAPSLGLYSRNTTFSAHKFLLEGNAYSAETIRVTGGLTTVTGSVDSNDNFSLLVPLTPNAVNTLVVEARDASGNVSTGAVVVTQNTTLSSFSGAIQINGDEISKVSQITGSGATETTKLTIEAPVVMRSGKNSVSATLPTGVEITTSTGGIFDSTQIDINPTTVTGGLGSRQTSRGAVEFGISNVPLHFSKPIKIEISVPSYTKSTIPVLVKHGGSSTFTTTGLTNNPNATCTNGIASSPSSTANVVGGVATIYSCAASTFTAVEESSRSGGGSSSSSSSSSTSSSTTQNTTATGTTVVSSTGSTQETESSEETTDTENTETDTTDTENTQTTSEEEIQTSNETPVHFSEKYVQILKEKGAISTDIDTFIPEQNITRAEFLKILFNVHGIKYEDTNTERNDFSDITGDDWTSKIAYTALDTGISSGYADKTFKANAPITRIEAIKFILKISGVVIPETSTSDFTDVTEDWMKKYVNKAKDLEIISGQETELGLIFRPLDHLSRGEAAKMVVKTMGAGQ